MAKSGSGETREAKTFTTRGVDALKADAAPYRVPDARTPGLAVRVAVDGRRTWDASFKIAGTGRVRRTSLGVYPDISLEAARDRARELARAARAGRDLLEEEAATKRDAAREITVANLIETYCARVVRGKLRTAKEIEARLKRTLAPLLHLKAVTIRRRDLREQLDSCADGGLLREAEKRRQTIGAMFRWAAGRDIIASDPMSGLGAYDSGTPRDRVLSDVELRKLWLWLDDQHIPENYAMILRLQILLGARIGEIGGMASNEFDLDNWLWTLPAARSKNKRPRVTPILGQARAILEPLLPSKGNLFVTERGGAIRATNVGNILNSRVRQPPVENFVTHDLRRTVASGMADLGIHYEIIAAVIGHDAGEKSTKTLLRHYVKTDAVERKHVALAAWDRHVAKILTVADTPNVVELRARAKR